MKTYKTPDNSLHCIEPDFEYMLPSGCVEITEAEAEAIRIANMPPPQIPTSITMRQARLALFQAGLLTNIDTTINSLPEPQQTSARISWDYSSTVERNNPVFIQLATALGLTSSQIDQLMISASQL